MAALGRLTALATQRLHQERHARLVLDEQLPQDLVQIGSMIPAGAAGQGHNVGVRGLLAVLAPSNLQARTVEMGKAGRQAQTRGGRRRSEPVECRHPGGKEAIHGTPEGIIMERCGGNTGGARRREVGLGWRHQGTRESA